LLRRYGHEARVFSAAPTERSWTKGRDANGTGAIAAVEWGAQFCLSVHSDGGYNGPHLSALVCYQEPRRADIADRLLKEYCKRTGYAPRGIQRRIPGLNGVAVLREPERRAIPALLLERGWHDREPDATDIRTRSPWFAEAICGAMLAVFGLGEKFAHEFKGVGGDEKVVDFIRQSARETGQGPLKGREVEVWRAFGCGAEYIHLAVTLGSDNPIVLFADSPYSQQHLGMTEVKPEFHGNKPVRLSEMFPRVGPSDYVWITAHLIPEDSARFRGFIRP